MQILVISGLCAWMTATLKMDAAQQQQVISIIITYSNVSLNSMDLLLSNTVDPMLYNLISDVTIKFPSAIGLIS